MEFSRQEYWSALPFPSPEDLPSPGIEPWSPAYSLPFELQGSPPAIWFLPYILIINKIMLTSLSPHLPPHTPKNTYLCNKGLIQNSLCLANNRIINSSCCALTEVWKSRSKRTENGRFKSTMRLKLEYPMELPDKIRSQLEENGKERGELCETKWLESYLLCVLIGYDMT